MIIQFWPIEKIERVPNSLKNHLLSKPDSLLKSEKRPTLYYKLTQSSLKGNSLLPTSVSINGYCRSRSFCGLNRPNSLLPGPLFLSAMWISFLSDCEEQAANLEVKVSRACPRLPNLRGSSSVPFMINQGTGKAVPSYLLTVSPCFIRHCPLTEHYLAHSPHSINTW